MDALPIELFVRGRAALVAGQGAEVLSKVERLVAAGALVTVFAPLPLEGGLAARVAEGTVVHEPRCARAADLGGQAVAFAAPGDDALAAELSAAARRAGIPFCALDRPELSTFANPALVLTDPVQLTVATGGASPGAARRIREDLEALFRDTRLAAFLEKMRALRSALPRGERATKMRRALEGFSIEARWLFPVWFERGEDPPERQ